MYPLKELNTIPPEIVLISDFNMAFVSPHTLIASDEFLEQVIVRCSQNPLWREHFENQAKHSYIVFAIV